MTEHFRLIAQSDKGDVFCNGDMHIRLSRIPESADGKDFRIVNLVCNCATRRPHAQFAEQVPA